MRLPRRPNISEVTANLLTNFREGSGNSIYNPLNGSVCLSNNTAVWEQNANPVGGHCLVNTGNSYAQSSIAIAPSTWMASGFTVDTLFYPTGTQNPGAYVSMQWGFRCRVVPAITGFCAFQGFIFDGNRANQAAVISTNCPYNKWVRVTFTYDRPLGKIRVYLNGILSGESTLVANMSLYTAADYFYLFKEYSGGWFAYGKFAYLSILNRPKSAAEIAADVFSKKSVMGA